MATGTLWGAKRSVAAASPASPGTLRGNLSPQAQTCDIPLCRRPRAPARGADDKKLTTTAKNLSLLARNGERHQ